jgi:CubicO group peptidase (beta-lactamase class C family)
MSRIDLSRAEEVIERGIADGAFPAAVALVQRRGEVLLHRAFGAAPGGAETIFDLASLTKVVACLPSILILLEEGALSLDEPVAHIIPEFAGPSADEDRRAVSLRHLLTHTSGLPAWLPLYSDCRTAEAAIARICATPLEASPGRRVVYSDLGFMLLGEIVRRVGGLPLDRFARERIFAPLGMRDTGYLPAPAIHGRIAPTEEGERYEAAMAAARGARHPQGRAGVIRGVVHDGNAHYALEGISGHAGLFATAADLARYAGCWLNGGALDGARLLSPATIAAATRDQTAALNLGRGLGWVAAEPDPIGRRARWLAAGGDPALTTGGGPTSGGELLGAGAYGHTGFTGTSLWLVPARDLAIILLTNRVHPDAANLGIARVRARFHNAVTSEVASAEC